ncbi:MAG: class I SAM-dependent methyltransferase, partial [Desulfobacterales bacterium]|nr:class I SAM-dependent methyltransferase [Desulfobacterales bacterium]
CESTETGHYTADQFRAYVICRACNLVFVPAPHRISETKEKARYDLHENHPDDPGYQKFLNRLFAPVCSRLTEGAAGLDFGCGPGPVLAAMFREQGYGMDTYDKFYACNPAVFEKVYDFITATEVLEHLHHPGRELERLWAMLKTGGVLGIMTKLVHSRQAFEKWHYKNDETHVCFFSRATFEWLADAWQAPVEFVGKDVVLLTKTRTGG